MKRSTTHTSPAEKLYQGWSSYSHSHVMIVFLFHIVRAAFQYGVKMSEGRKTRRFGGGMTGKAKEKAKLNREWQQISAVSFTHNLMMYIYCS